MRPDQILDLTTRYPAQSGIAALAGILVLFAAGRAARTTARRATKGKRSEDVLTVLAAVIATSVQATGMWRFFRDVLHMPPVLRILLFAFIEVAVLTSALRAKRNVAEHHSGGVDGIAVWALTALSAVLSAMDSRSAAEVTFRLAAPMVAAWLWHRSMSAERRRRTGRRINWRLTPERILVRLGLAEAADRTASEVDAHRRITRVARRAKALRTLKALGARPWHLRLAQRRLDAAMDQAVEHAQLAAAPDRQDALMAQLGAMYNTAELADLSPAAPWIVPATPSAPKLYRVCRPSHPALSYVDDDLFPDTPAGLAEWLDNASGDDEPGVPAEQVPVPPYVTSHQIEGARVFADEVRRGHVPGIRAIKKRMNIAQEKAQQVRAYLKYLITIGDASALAEEKEPQHA